jgi:hypothetical protein
VGLFKEVADIKTADQLNLPRPEAHYHDVVIEPSEYQQSLIESLADRAEAVRKREVEPTVDNMCEQHVTATNHGENVTKAVTA